MSPSHSGVSTPEDIEEMSSPFKKSVVLVEEGLIGTLLPSEIPVGGVSAIAVALKTGQKASFMKRMYLNGNFFTGGGTQYQKNLAV